MKHEEDEICPQNKINLTYNTHTHTHTGLKNKFEYCRTYLLRAAVKSQQ